VVRESGRGLGFCAQCLVVTVLVISLGEPELGNWYIEEEFPWSLRRGRFSLGAGCVELAYVYKGDISARLEVAAKTFGGRR